MADDRTKCANQLSDFSKSKRVRSCLADVHVPSRSVSTYLPPKETAIDARARKKIVGLQ